MKALIGITVIVVIGGGIWLFVKNDEPVADHTHDELTEDHDHDEDINSSGTEEEINNDMVGELKEFTIEGGMFYYAPDQITVRKGDTVRIVFNNVEGFHDFVIDEFEVATPQINAGNQAVVEFVASETGQFEFYCSVGNHRAQGMVGVLTVTE